MTEPHSTTGVLDNGQAYAHISIHPVKEALSSCNACGRQTYKMSDWIEEPRKSRSQTTWAHRNVIPTGLVLAEVHINPNGYQSTVLRFCPECLNDLQSKLGNKIALEHEHDLEEMEKLTPEELALEREQDLEEDMGEL